MNKIAMIAAAAAALAATSAQAEVIFDAATGTGFIGKGDVQLALGWNNKQLQDGASTLVVRAVSQESTETSWVCQNPANQNLREVSTETKTLIRGTVVLVARLRNQITGFNVTGYDGSESISTTTTGNLGVNECQRNWVLVESAGDPVFAGSNINMTVNGVDLPLTEDVVLTQ
jgi:opacity protein-like surface antigen